MSAATEAPIEFRAVSKTYRLGFFANRRVQALRALDLRVEAGQVYGILGPNGAGKSTTIKILLNLVQPSAGEVRLMGARPGIASARSLVGYVPENPMPYEYLTGREFVTLSGRLSGLGGRDLETRVEEVLERLRMRQAASIQIRRYSKGMVQRIALAQAVIHRPKLLVLDEPTSGLDPVGRREMRDLILEERARGTTILFCTHIISDVESICERVAVLIGGRLAREGSVRELLATESPKVEFLVDGITRSAMETFNVPVLSAREVGDRLLVQTDEQVSQQFASKIITSGGHLLQMQAVNHSLEDLLIETMRNVDRKVVGGDIA